MNAPSSPEASSQSNTGIPPKTSGLAVASLILGILGFLIVPAIAGLVCGIVGMSQIRRSAGALKGQGIALAGTIVSGLMLVISPVVLILAGLLLPALAHAKGRAQSIMGMNNVRQLSLAVQLYSTDSNDRFPTSSKWCDQVQVYVGGTTAFVRPADQGRGVRSSYGYNARLSDAKATDVDKNTVVIFELQAPGWNVSGGPELVRMPTSRGDSVVIGFADGRAEPVPPARLPSLRWDP